MASKRSKGNRLINAASQIAPKVSDPVFVKYQDDMSDANRVESGMLQFPKDWPGLFIRGDDAMVIMGELRSLFDLVRSSVSYMDKLTAGGVSLSKLPQLVELIDKHVKGKKRPVRKGSVRNHSFRSDQKFIW